MEYTFTISNTIVARNEDEAEKILLSKISVPDDFVIELTGKYDPETGRTWQYIDYYGWEEL